MRALVVGGSSGIGAATARRFADIGVDVIVVGRDQGRLEAVVKEIGSRATAQVLDVADTAAVGAFCSEPTTYDHIVLAASGASGAGPFATLSLDELRAGFEGKFWINVQLLQAALPRLAPEASITFVTAGSSRAGLAGTSGLAAINGALDAIVRPLATELGPRRVNAVSPGVVDTPWWDAAPSNLREQVFSSYAEAVPVNRVGRAGDVADLVVAIATNGFVTGSVVDVAGGGQIATGR